MKNGKLKLSRSGGVHWTLVHYNNSNQTTPITGKISNSAYYAPIPITGLQLVHLYYWLGNIMIKTLNT